MKRLVVFFSLACLLTLCLGGTARALSSPTIDSVIPAAAPNDVDTPVVIHGSGFSSDPTAPTVTLGATLLTAVTFVNDTTLSATVPAGLAPGLYDLTVTNPDSGSATLTGAFTVTLPPTVSAIDPAIAYNDLDTPVTVTGADFATAAGGTVLPTATLNGVPLTDVAFVSATTLTATVPWGMDAGPCLLAVTNPDGGTGILSGAFTVQPGIGHWNGGDLFGGEVRTILMKPGDPHTLYAPAYGIHGLFRSTDAGEQWSYTGADLPIGNGALAIDPTTPGRLYACTYKGLQRSTDDGDTWTTIMPNTWPDGRDWADTEVFPSPTESGVLFICSHDDWGFPASGNALGLIKSTNGGTSWHIVSDLEGVSVVDVDFDPDNPQQMVLVTTDAHVFKSTDGGDHWTQAPASPPLAGVGLWGRIAYNPYKTSEVWIVCNTPGGVFKSTDAALTGWTDESPPYLGGNHITFTGADSVYVVRFHSTDGGTSWDPFGPTYANGQLVFDPDDPQVGYIGDSFAGVQKTTDGGATWEVKNQGLAGLTCASMDVSRADPLRVYAAMGGSPGAYRSDDGASDWNFFSLGVVSGLYGIREDPTDSSRVYGSGNGSFFSSTDRGTTWANLGWNATPPVPTGMGWTMEPDPFQPGHVLVSIGSGMYLTDEGYLYSSTDYGASWQQIAMPQTVDLINDIAFDPVTPGLVYLTTMGTGVYRSTDHGDSDTWVRVDDPEKQPDLQSTGYEQCIAIATHPQHMVTVGANAYVYRSVDEGATWQRSKGREYPGEDMFVDGDSTRLYRGTGEGLFFSKDVGDTWSRAAGAFGHLQIMQVGYADMDGRAIIYAATNGGQSGASSSTASAASRRAATAVGAPVTAGVYRYVVVNPDMTLKLSGLRASALRLGHRVTAKGVVTPGSLAGSKVSLTVQRRQNGAWRKVKTVTRAIGASGAYGWSYQPAKKGSYRLRATMTKTATHTSATTIWRSFKVK